MFLKAVFLSEIFFSLENLHFGRIYVQQISPFYSHL